MATLTILADDLSGAADCGLQAAQRGLRTLVTLTAPREEQPGIDVLAWDLDTRTSSAAQAFDRTRAAARSVATDGPLYLKMDSILRGNVGAAIDAGLSATGARAAIVAPAFPLMGRTTAGGLHRIVPPGVSSAPVTKDLLAVLRRQSRHRVAHLSLEHVRRARAAGVVDGLDGPGPWVVACDAEDERDLALIVEAFAGSPGAVVWAGSAGLAAALVNAPAQSRPASPSPRPAARGPVLVVAGSTARETLAQVETVSDRGSAAVVAVQAEALAGDQERARAEITVAATALGGHLAAGRDGVLHARGHIGDAPGLRARVARGLGETARLAAQRAGPGALVLTGGETARSVCQALGIEAIELLGEVEPGVPFGRAVGSDLPIITKAGAFGSAGSLLHALDTLCGRSECPVP